MSQKHRRSVLPGICVIAAGAYVSGAAASSYHKSDDRHEHMPGKAPHTLAFFSALGTATTSIAPSASYEYVIPNTVSEGEHRAESPVTDHHVVAEHRGTMPTPRRSR